ncbi:hypothetical protein [Clostridium butyricum]
MNFELKLSEKELYIISTLLNEEHKKQCDGLSESCRLGDNIFFNLMIDINTILHDVHTQGIDYANKYDGYRCTVK